MIDDLKELYCGFRTNLNVLKLVLNCILWCVLKASGLVILFSIDFLLRFNTSLADKLTNGIDQNKELET